MIAKKIKRKKGSTSNYVKLIDYLLSDKALDVEERVVATSVTNCLSGDDIHFAKKEVMAKQALNQMVKSDKTYHLVLSFQAEDKVTPKMIKEMEREFCNGLGYRDHQRISVTHGDTNNLHVHIAINKIHPKTLKIHDPSFDLRQLRTIREEMERKYDLLPNSVGKEQGNEVDRQGFTSFETWVKENAKAELLKAFETAKSWHELQEVAGKFDLEFRKSGAGMAISHKSENLYIKASSVSRELTFKNLIAKFGEFDETNVGKIVVSKLMSYEKAPNASESRELWNDYLAYKDERKVSRNNVWSDFKLEKVAAFAALNEKTKDKKIMVKVSKKLGFIDKKIERSKIAAEYIYKRNEISKMFAEKSSKISEENKTLSWADWLHERSERGDLEAIKTLQEFKKRNPLKKDEALVTGRSGFEPKNYLADIRYDIKRNGDIHYKIGDSVVVDHGRGIRVSQGASNEAIDFAVELAKKRFGSNLKVEGSRELCAEINKKIQKGLER